ncbi:MAG: Enoyl-CoA hydratase (EC / Delta(3)-cis-delta(2)-trans-enoyl-CoA isomerase (EC / 3-hydroxyacyl-CoA dehydrogenase (EC / 3-hydroxybutyryl-CoA epimerase (EC [uncultured Paraburkholderia sp.]|nr:MAG: Enoyl-CoA hydratase (EC / Delta(3)-cis-delta(2)-trans-enoyl-CoA isomerase (EC / 3-hydroxyacyl-CoA dehydrogenase (EC / 3-hydroxybutyryl-CoA epimerase (EC [uncultured Paraburkholderia sp.]CAH2931032.1 MAG: Enoyl-CoA hydratase (EC / Delta(3)-cis-delta(2)-trans-enoyl-CoA isomerase (EC / 3-hydroxyacyl-CoA dehydrogenase (EC / 3-hydroxybutyryl-CoA epimerase (EC [uncultured Paraburkholderia sp.]
MKLGILLRAIGLEAALNMIVSGAPVMSEKLVGSGLFDEVVQGNLAEAALEFACKVGAKEGPHPKVRDRKIEHPNAAGFIQFARNTVTAMAKNFPEPLKCIGAVEAGVQQGFDKGLAFEHECFVALVQTPESRALRHAFFGERTASKIPDVPFDTPTRNIERVGVIGACTMGGGIAMNFINAGIPVTLLETKQDALERGLATICKNYEATVRKGKLKPEAMEQRMALITPTLSYDDLKSADLIVEAVFEEFDVKEQVFRQLDEIAKPGAILASNTSTLDVDRIAAFTKRSQDVVGMHFFSPANVMKLLEVVRGKETAKDVLVTVMKLAKKTARRRWCPACATVSSATG